MDTTKHTRSAEILRAKIEKAIDDGKLTRAEYDDILHQATADGHIDPMEQSLLNQLQGMIEDRSVKLVP